MVDPTNVLTPPDSAASPSASTTSGIAYVSQSLPTPRKHPLAQGSTKEIHLIHYLDDQLLRVFRRYEKRLPEEQRTAAAAPDDAPGYENMDQVVTDLDPLVDVVWVSHTPHLQVAYFLSIAGDLCAYMPAFPFTASIFPILSKIDQAFVSLLSIPVPTPGTSSALHPPSKTDKVRIKSLTEDIRVTAVNTATKSGIAADLDDSSDDEFDGQLPSFNGQQNEAETTIEAGFGRIFKGTIEILGDSLT